MDATFVSQSKKAISLNGTLTAANRRPTMTSNGCPFKARKGYVDARSDYLFHFHKVVEDDDDYEDNNDNPLPTQSLEASTNLKDPLYFWQLYSLIGVDPIRHLVTDFYERVFADIGNAWFRDVFVHVAPLEHHIHTQVAYWVDAFGGGRRYHGGNYRLNFHHYHNAKEIMNAKGAQRWMHHMRAALLAAKEQAVFQKDPRILPCIVEFLEAKMRTYAMDHRWKFDEADFEPLKIAFGMVKDNNKMQAAESQVDTSL